MEIFLSHTKGERKQGKNGRLHTVLKLYLRCYIPTVLLDGLLTRRGSSRTYGSDTVLPLCLKTQRFGHNRNRVVGLTIVLIIN